MSVIRILKALSALPILLALVCAAFAVISLSGYVSGHDYLYRPIPGGASTHPLTAVSILLISVSTIGGHWQECTRWRIGMTVVAAVIEIIRISDWVLGHEFHTQITPFQSVVASEVAAGLNNGFGINTALALLGISIARILADLKRPVASQIVVFSAIALPNITLIGYAYSLPKIYGQMSLLTATLTLILGSTVLFETAGKDLMQSALTRGIRRIGFLHMVAGFWIPVLLGYLVFQAIPASTITSGKFIGLYVVGTCWIFMILAGVANVFYQRLLEENRQLLAAMTEAAETDQLTELANRRRFKSFGEFEFERALRTGRPLWAIVIDVDYFKDINDSAGHDAGDATLVAIAQLLRQHSRAIDLVARLGGDEFAAILTDTPREGAQTWVHQLQQRAAALHVQGQESIAVQLSIGAACTSGKASLGETLKSADYYLYEAKEAGRNRAVLEPEPSVSLQLKASA